MRKELVVAMVVVEQLELVMELVEELVMEMVVVEPDPVLTGQIWSHQFLFFLNRDHLMT